MGVEDCRSHGLKRPSYDVINSLVLKGMISKIHIILSGIIYELRETSFRKALLAGNT